MEKKVEVQVLRPFWIVEDGERRVVDSGKIELPEVLAAELEAAGKVSFELSKRGRPPKDEAVDPMDASKSKKGK